MTNASPRAIDGAALTLAWLSFASGSTDVLSFLRFGDVFTSAMTGNTALLVIAIGQGHLLAASHALTALLGFTLGAALAALPGAFEHATRGPRARLLRLLLIEIACLGGGAALWSLGHYSLDSRTIFPVILLSALSMGIQGVAARIINSSGISTIVFTSVLISIMTSLIETFSHRDDKAPVGRVRPHLGSFGAYALGGLLAGALVTAQVQILVWIPMAAVIAALGCYYFWGAERRSA